MTNEKLVDRLEWWLAYFNDETEGDPHPDFVDNPEGFDETAIEPDLRAAIIALDTQKLDLEEFKRTMKEKGIPFLLHYMYMKTENQNGTRKRD